MAKLFLAPNIEHFNFGGVKTVRISRPRSFAEVARVLEDGGYEEVVHTFRSSDPIEVLLCIVPSLRGKISYARSFSMRPGDRFASFRVIWGVPGDDRRHHEGSIMQYVKDIKMIVFDALE